MENIILNTKKALERNNMDCFVVQTKQDALQLLKQLLKENASVAVGGSVTLNSVGVIDLLRCGEYNFIDRYESGISPEETQDRLRKGLLADYFICSSNAITKDGCLYNVDGTGNRVAALCFGPKNVIVIAGKNKIVENLDEAQLRVKSVAAPQNCVRLGLESYCSKTGKCISLNDKNAPIYNGCASDSRICCTHVISARQRIKGRIKVILVNEDLGY